MSKVYLAGRYSRKEELCSYAADLRQRGHEIVSSWLYRENDSIFETTPIPIRMDCAWVDAKDIKRADVVIVFTTPYDDPERPRGGYDVEFGLSYWSTPIYIVGQRINVFHYLVPFWETWESFLASAVL